jgi:hypothetical protein
VVDSQGVRHPRYNIVQAHKGLSVTKDKAGLPRLSWRVPAVVANVSSTPVYNATMNDALLDNGLIGYVIAA